MSVDSCRERLHWLTKTAGVKFLLFLYCFGYRNTSSQVRMLWEDHRNDLFINGFGEYPIKRVREGEENGTYEGDG